MVRVATWPNDSFPEMGGVRRDGVSRNAEITDTEARHKSARSARKCRCRSRRCQKVGSAFAVIGATSLPPAAARPRVSVEGGELLPGSGISRLLPGLGQRLGQGPLG